jgi:PPM family protein phosphatase
MNLSIGAKTDVGRMREVNEDSYLVHEPLFVVADGMGGHIAGDVASSTAIKVIEEQSDTASADDMETLATLVRNANSRIWDRAQADPTLHGMGTTCTLMLLDGSKAHIAHVGDSRAYLWRDGKLTQLTEDHSLVGRMVKEGRLTPEEAEKHPQRSIVTRAVGVDSNVDVDLLSVDLKEGDRLLLCSDGLYSMTYDKPIGDVLASERDPQAAVDRLVELANQAGGEDNITVVVLDLGPDGRGASSAVRQTTQTARPTQRTMESTRPSAAARVTTEHRRPGQTASITTAHQMPVTAPPHRSTPTAEEAPAREDREDDAAPAQGDEAPRTWPKKLAIGLLVLLVLGVGGFFAARYFLANSWYVGVNGDGKVAVFRGIPEEIAGFTFSDQERSSDLSLNQLPKFLRGGPRKGIKVDSLDAALKTIEELKSQATEEEQTNHPSDNTKDNSTQDKKKKG